MQVQSMMYKSYTHILYLSHVKTEDRTLCCNNLENVTDHHQLAQTPECGRTNG